MQNNIGKNLVDEIVTSFIFVAQNLRFEMIPALKNLTI